MFLDRLICRFMGHTPFPAQPRKCSRCGKALTLSEFLKTAAGQESVPQPAPQTTASGASATVTIPDALWKRPAAPRGSIIPWWYGTHGAIPPGWREPTARTLWDGRVPDNVEHEAALSRLLERKTGRAT